MDMSALLALASPLGSPAVFAALVGLAAACVWLALAPARAVRDVQLRLEDLVGSRSPDPVVEEEMRESLLKRAVVPLVKGVLHLLGRFAPVRGLSTVDQQLLYAGSPGGMTALDFYGVRLLVALAMGGLGFWMGSMRSGLSQAVMLAPLMGAVGFFLPVLWLSRRREQRKKEIAKALPNALDMLTIGVEAGLAFESAMMRVAQHWDNALTRELRRAVLEMRVGTPRDAALQHMADRVEVPELRTFVAVLVQSSQLGVGIASVLHSQAAIMREKRRQRAEELARQAAVKMAIPLVLLIFPAMFVVILGPAIPGIMNMFR